MKAIIIDTFGFYDFRTKYIYNELVENGYDVTILSSDFEHLGKKYRTSVRDNTVFLHAKSYRKNLSFARLRSHIAFAKTVYKELIARKPDLIYCFLPINSLGKYVYKFKKRFPDTKIYFDICDLWPESLPTAKWIKKLLFPWRRLRDQHLHCADKIFLECEYYKQFLPSRLNYVTAYLCKERREIEYLHEGKTLEFVYLGSINSIIDTDGIVELLSEVNKARPIRVHIIGGGEQEDVFLKKLSDAQIDTMNHGKIFDDGEKDKIIAQCHFGINMYKAGLSIGLTMKSLDYFCRGLPVLSRNIYDTKNLIRKYECGVDAEAESSVEKLIATNEESWENMHNNACDVCEKYFSIAAYQRVLKNNLENS